MTTGQRDARWPLVICYADSIESMVVVAKRPTTGIRF
jgi:hypothetical protein